MVGGRHEHAAALSAHCAQPPRRRHRRRALGREARPRPVALDLHPGRRGFLRRFRIRSSRRARRPHLQRRYLCLDDLGQRQVRDRVPDRPLDRADDAGGHLRLADGAHLHHRLHGRRSGLHPLFFLHLAVHLQHAYAGDGQQLPAALLRLGGGRAGFVPADRLLASATSGSFSASVSSSPFSDRSTMRPSSGPRQSSRAQCSMWAPAPPGR